MQSKSQQGGHNPAHLHSDAGRKNHQRILLRYDRPNDEMCIRDSPPRKTETEAEKNQQTTIKPTNSCATSGQTATDPVGKAPVSASPQVESIEAQKTPETDSKN